MNKRKILRVLRKAKSLTLGRLVTSHKKMNPERCAIGELLHHAGVSDERMRKNQALWCTQESRRLLKTFYGLASNQVGDIVNCNDSAKDSKFAKKCSFKGHKGTGAQKKRNQARACIVVKEIERMKA